MRAVVLSAPGRMEIRDVPRDAPAPHEVLLRVRAVGLCGTDFHIYAGHANYTRDESGRPVPLTVRPQILGHEIVGEVEEAGARARDLRPGQAVVVDQGRTCVGEGRSPICEYCATGDSHQCEHYREHGITGLPGGFAESIVVPATNAIPLGPRLDPAWAALTEPLGCIVHSCDMLRRASARYVFGAADSSRIRSVLIVGGGIAGLLFVQYLRTVLGFDGTLLVSEPAPLKRGLAERFGAQPIDPLAVDLAEAVLEETHGRRAELLIDASGVGAIFEAIPGLIRKQATVLLYGHGHDGVDLSVLNNVQFMEPTLVAPAGASGGFERDGRPSTYVTALRLLETGRIQVEPLVTHRYDSLDAIPGAFAGEHRAPGYVKGVVTL
jgi:L-iditol 2-dehydrogenase